MTNMKKLQKDRFLTQIMKPSFNDNHSPKTEEEITTSVNEAAIQAFPSGLCPVSLWGVPDSQIYASEIQPDNLRAP